MGLHVGTLIPCSRPPKLDSAIPRISTPEIKHIAHELVTVFSWAAPPVGMDGISVLVNDVERSRKFFNDGIDKNANNFEFSRPASARYNEYVRFAFLREGRTLDYSDAGILFGNGTWFMPDDDDKQG